MNNKFIFFCNTFYYYYSQISQIKNIFIDGFFTRLFTIRWHYNPPRTRKCQQNNFHATKQLAVPELLNRAQSSQFRKWKLGSACAHITLAHRFLGILSRFPLTYFYVNIYNISLEKHSYKVKKKVCVCFA